MRPTLLVDMNLSPEWIPALQKHGWQAVHWSDIGDPRASDRDIMGLGGYPPIRRVHSRPGFRNHAGSNTRGWPECPSGSRREHPSRATWKVRSSPRSTSTSPTCPLAPWSWLTRAEAGFECCRYETTHSRGPTNAGLKPTLPVSAMLSSPAWHTLSSSPGSRAATLTHPQRPWRESPVAPVPGCGSASSL